MIQGCFFFFGGFFFFLDSVDSLSSFLPVIFWSADPGIQHLKCKAEVVVEAVELTLSICKFGQCLSGVGASLKYSVIPKAGTVLLLQYSPLMLGVPLMYFMYMHREFFSHSYILLYVFVLLHLYFLK